MNPLKAALEAAEQTAKARRRVENNFVKALKGKLNYQGDGKAFGEYLEFIGVQCYEHEVQMEHGSFVLYHAKDKNEEVITSMLFEWDIAQKDGVLRIEIKGAALDISTDELNEIIAKIESDDELEEKECDCPVCQLRRTLH